MYAQKLYFTSLHRLIGILKNYASTPSVVADVDWSAFRVTFVAPIKLKVPTEGTNYGN